MHLLQHKVEILEEAVMKEPMEAQISALKYGNFGNSCLYKYPLDISLRNLSASSVIKPQKIKHFRTFFENYGFSDAQISKLSAREHMLKYSLQEVFLPKLKFLLSIGVSRADLPKVIMQNTALLATSLDRQLIPCYNFLKKLVNSDGDIVRILKRSTRIFSCNLKVIVPNVELLREAGVPESSISYSLTHNPHSVQMKCDKFKRSIDRVIKLGFDPSRVVFVRAVHVLCETSDKAWENRMKVYGSFGLSKTEILSAFKSHPLCMTLSEEKIRRAMQFYVNEMSLSPAEVARSSVILFYNFERRISPRFRVIKILMEKGLVKKFSLVTRLSMTDENFKKRFLHSYENVLPEIMDIYRTGQGHD